jgi:hypothetical protein
MTTEIQIAANQRNAKRSTGPRSQQGKAIISQNALKHGLSATQTVINTENQQEFDRHSQQILDEFNPETPMEYILVDRLVNLSWRLKRTTHLQSQTIDTLTTPPRTSPLAKLRQSLLPKDLDHSQPDSAPQLPLGRMVVKDFSNSRVLEKLLMYERRIESSLYKTILEIQRLNMIKHLKPTV